MHKLLKASQLYQRVVRPLLDGRMVEVGGKVMEVGEIGEVEEGMGGQAQGAEAGRLGAEEEGRFIKRLIDPRLPTEEEVEHHMLTHLPYAGIGVLNVLKLKVRM